MTKKPSPEAMLWLSSLEDKNEGYMYEIFGYLVDAYKSHQTPSPETIKMFNALKESLEGIQPIIDDIKPVIQDFRRSKSERVWQRIFFGVAVLCFIFSLYLLYQAWAHPGKALAWLDLPRPDVQYFLRK